MIYYSIDIMSQDESSLLEHLAPVYSDTDWTTGEILEASVADEVNGVQELAIKVSRSMVTPANFAIGNIARLVTNLNYVTYRIKALKETQGNNKKTYIECVCEHLKYDLQDVAITESRQWIQTSANDILDYILTNYASSWSRGTITNGTEEYDFSLEYGETVYSCIKRLADTLQLETLYHATGHTVSGHDADWKEIDILLVDNVANGTPGTLTLNTTENVKSVKYDRDARDNFATEVFASGGSANVKARNSVPDNKTVMTVQDSEFIIKSYSSGWIVFYSKNILVEPNALNDYYLYVRGPVGVHASGMPTQILDSAKGSTGDALEVDPGAFSTPPAEGDAVVLVKKNGLSLLDKVPNEVLASSYWDIASTYQDEAFEDYINIAGPHGRSDMSSFNTGLCVGWTKIGSPTCTEDTNTAYIINGTSTQKVIAADGEGVYRELRTSEATGEKFDISFWVWLTVTNLATDTYVDARIKYDTDKIAPDTGGLWVQDGNTTERIIGETSAAPQRILVGGLNIEKISGFAPRLEIIADGGNATFYIDSVCVVKHPVPLGRDRFTVWDSRARLWEDAVIDYKSRMALTQEYSAEILDIYHMAPTTNSGYQFTSGDYATLTAVDLDIDAAVRIVKKSFDVFDPVRTCRVDIETVSAGKNIRAKQAQNERAMRATRANEYSSKKS